MPLDPHHLLMYDNKKEGSMDINAVLAKMPLALADHLRSLMKLCGFDGEPDKQKAFLSNWLKKKAFFDKIVEHQGFHCITRLEPGFKQGVVILTYSGSLLTLSVEDEHGNREAIYNSIDLRKDVVQKTEDKNAQIIFPLECHKALVAKSGKIKKTSPILTMAIEDNPEYTSEEKFNKLRLVGERISKTLIVVNQELYSKHSVKSELENRDDLFDRWVTLTWFRIGGWEEDVFLARVRILWLELFSKSYNDLSGKVKETQKRDECFLVMVNTDFPRFIDDYKWLESEKINRDLGLMIALEQIPGRKDYEDFIRAEIDRF
jgi:hypothetical protein